MTSANSNLFVLVNAAAVATDEVYYATETGQILDVDYRDMRLFRKTPLYTLLGGVTSTIGRLGRPNNAIEFVKRQRDAARDRSSIIRRSPRDSVLREGSQISPRTGTLNLQRRGTVSFVKNIMLQKINSKQTSIDEQNASGDNRNSDFNFGALNRLRQRGNNQSMHVRGRQDISSFQ